MIETLKIELTRKQLDDGILLPNHVIVEMTHNNDYKTTKSGVVIGLPDRSTYNDNALGADMQEVWGVVYRTPEKLFFDKDSPDSMDWETDMEVKKSDVVWFSIMDSANSHQVECEEKLYKIIPYQELYVAKRVKEWKDIDDSENPVEIIPLNGYILCQTINCKKLSDLDVTTEAKVDKTKAIVRHVGSCNKQYKTEGYKDMIDVRVGDEILLDRFPLLYLERKKTFATFDGDNLYVVVPRRKIAFITKRND